MINLNEIKKDPEKIKAFLSSDEFKNLPFHVRNLILIQLGESDPNNN